MIASKGWGVRPVWGEGVQARGVYSRLPRASSVARSTSSGTADLAGSGRQLTSPLTCHRHGDERGTAFTSMCEAMPRFADYQASVDREIPLVALRPTR